MCGWVGMEWSAIEWSGVEWIRVGGMEFSRLNSYLYNPKIIIFF